MPKFLNILSGFKPSIFLRPITSINIDEDKASILVDIFPISFMLNFPITKHNPVSAPAITVSAPADIANFAGSILDIRNIEAANTAMDLAIFSIASDLSSKE